MKSPSSWFKVAALVSAMPFMLTSTMLLAQNPDATTLPNGAELSVEILNPVTDQEFLVPAALGPGGTIDVLTDGEASVGQGTPNIHVTFVMDVSGSTSNTSYPCLGGLVIACEQQAVVNVINDPNFTSVKDVGISVFATSGASADMTAAAGDDPLTSDFEEAKIVANSTYSVFGGDGGVAAFTNKVVGVETSFIAGLTAANNSVAASTAATKRVFYLSDGLCTCDLTAFDAAVAALGVQIDSFAIGALASCGSPLGSSLQRMADLSGGTCTELPDPGDIVTALPDLIATSLDSLSASLNTSLVPTTTVPAVLPVDGPITASYNATYLNLGVGDYVCDAQAAGSDSADTDTVTATEPFHLLQLTAWPATATNELSEDNEHTVYGQILGGTGPERDMNFLVSGTNASTAVPGADVSGVLPGDSEVPFDYMVPVSCLSLGQDTITVSTTIAGVLDSIDLYKDWVDTIPPEAACVESVNPAGDTIPAAPGEGGQGQNQDGFYELLAEDNLVDDCAPLELFVTDDGSGTVFGPFPVGTKIKYTQAPGGKPRAMAKNGAADAIDFHIWGNGDALLTAVDQSGNTSDPVECLVPPAPK